MMEKQDDNNSFEMSQIDTLSAILNHTMQNQSILTLLLSKVSSEFSKEDQLFLDQNYLELKKQLYAKYGDISDLLP